MYRAELTEHYRLRDDSMAVRVLMLGESLQSVADDFGIRASSVGAVLKTPWKDYYDLSNGNVNIRRRDWEEARHPFRDPTSSMYPRGWPVGPITDTEVEAVFRAWPPVLGSGSRMVVDMGEV